MFRSNTALNKYNQGCSKSLFSLSVNLIVLSIKWGREKWIIPCIISTTLTHDVCFIQPNSTKPKGIIFMIKLYMTKKNNALVWMCCLRVRQWSPGSLRKRPMSLKIWKMPTAQRCVNIITAVVILSFTATTSR